MGVWRAPELLARMTPRVELYFPGSGYKWAYHLVRLALALVFVVAGAAKISDPKAFAVLISHYGLVPDFLLAPAAVGLPLAEILLGLGLAGDIKGSLAGVSALIVLFLFVLWFGILKGLDVDCGCFSTRELAEHAGLRAALYRDFGFAAMAAFLYGCRFAWRKNSLP
ncbi:MAG: DoxX family protein [Proteobacteria bacterium]|nr:DoxX family protein [Pseudomonadota bacterium]